MSSAKQFSAILVRLLLCVSLCLPVVSAQDTQSSKTPPDVTIIIQQDKVRFASQKSVVEMRLQVFNDLGELVYDSGSITEQEINWPLHNGIGVALKISKITAPFDSPAGATKQVWAMALRSPEALGLRLHFVNFDVGAGAVIVYARRGAELVTLGPFTSKGPEQDGDFWTTLSPGATAFIEVSGVAVPQLKISEVMHFDQDITGGLSGANSQRKFAEAAEFGCHLDVMCEEVSPIARDATVLLTYAVGGGGASCTGTLLTDLDGETVVPYVLTANHCELTAANVNSLMTTFLFQNNACGGSVGATLPPLSGGVVLESEEDNDMKFIRLNGRVPAGVALAGWSTDGPSDGSYGIHHPGATFKRATFFKIPDPSEDPVECVIALFLNHWVMKAERGGLEGGSSGSGLFNSQGQLLGQLGGNCGSGKTPAGNCASDEDWLAFYGKFSITLWHIWPWLEMGGTINVDGGYDDDELGTPSQPFRRVTDGYNFAWDHTRLKIRTGVYSEALTFSKPMTIVTNGGPVIIGR